MPNLGDLEDRAARDISRELVYYEKQVATALNDALTTIYGQMQKIYDKYAKDGILTKAEMTRYNRLASLEKQLVATLGPAIQANVNLIRRVPANIYGASFFHTAWALDNGAGLRLSWGLLNKAVIAADLANTFATISLQRYPLFARFNIRTAMAQGLTVGKGYQQMARDLKTAINKTYAEALRTLRTEGQYAVNAGQAFAYDVAQTKGVEGHQVWDATLDARTRPTHGAADGQVQDKNGMFTVGGEKTPYPAWEGLSAAERINCRCRLRFQVDGYAPGLRRTRESGIVLYQTYADWSKGRKIWR